jgi:hypothetical protein
MACLASTRRSNRLLIVTLIVNELKCIQSVRSHHLVLAPFDSLYATLSTHKPPHKVCLRLDRLYNTYYNN